MALYFCITTCAYDQSLSMFCEHQFFPFRISFQMIQISCMMHYNRTDFPTQLTHLGF